jgi:hypothetical protein
MEALVGKDSFPVAIWKNIKWLASEFLEDPVGNAIFFAPPAAVAVGSAYALKTSGFSYYVTIPTGVVVMTFGSVVRVIVATTRSF